MVSLTWNYHLPKFKSSMMGTAIWHVFINHCYICLPTDMPRIRGLHTPVVIGEQQHITCHGIYRNSWNVTFVWQKYDSHSTTALEGYLESDNPNFIWALNYTFTAADHWDTLHCIVRVNIEGNVQQQHEAQVDKRIQLCGMWEQDMYVCIDGWMDGGWMIARARMQFNINKHRCCNWHLCIPDGLSAVQCRLGNIIGIVF